MKKIFKIIGFLVFALFVIYGFWYYNRITNNEKVNIKNKEFINNQVFSKDSENRGYSDDAKKMMDEDLKIVGNDKEIKKLYELVEKSKRNLVLSKNKKEYINNFILWSKYKRCVVNLKIEKYPDVQLKNLLKTNNNEESIKMNNVGEYKSQEFLKNSTFEENHKMMNTFPTEKECGDFLNE